MFYMCVYVRSVCRSPFVVRMISLGAWMYPVPVLYACFKPKIMFLFSMIAATFNCAAGDKHDFLFGT